MGQAKKAGANVSVCVAFGVKSFLIGAALLLGALLRSAPVAAQALPIDPFWPREPATGAVQFDGHSRLKGETPAQSADHLRLWLTAYFSDWKEYTYGDTTKLFFTARLRGLHKGVVLRCAVGAKLEPNGFRFILSQFKVGAPNGAGTVFWHPLHQLLNDPDFRPDINQFQQELQQALANL